MFEPVQPDLLSIQTRSLARVLRNTPHFLPNGFIGRLRVIDVTPAI
ncbi:hypothetical protein OO012_17790 [Rhodobacteraceae bacterium KMM 6894]|nr:hypothetical protein [Rhodobacteraceae bacterium KMM 6894]